MEIKNRRATSKRITNGPLILLCGTLLLVHALTFAQNELPPSVADQIAPGVAALKAGNLDAAERVFTDALRQGNKHPLLFHNLGIIAQQRGNQQQAVARFREALLLQPDYAPSRLLLGSSLLALHRNTEAAHELKRAATLMPHEPQAHLQLAKAYEASDNWISAVQEMEKLVELEPREPEYSYQLGRAWAKLSEWSYQQIGRIDPKTARLQQALGQEYAVQENYDLALNAYRSAARLDPKLPEIHLGIALICLELKRYDDALSEVEAELKLVPESKSAADAKAKILAAKNEFSR